MAERKTRVLLFDRQVDMMIRLLSFFEARPDIEIVEANQNVGAFLKDTVDMELRARMDLLKPDVVIVDLREPLHSDLVWIAKVRELTFAPIVAFTACRLPGKTISGLTLFEVVRRPDAGDPDALLAALRMLAYAVRRARRSADPSIVRQRAKAQAPALPPYCHTELIAIGASAGGTEAILEILSGLPADMPPILIVQHITRGFVELFSSHIDHKSALTAKVAENGETALPGHAYLAPEGAHLAAERHADRYILRYAGEERISGHLPSIDALFASVAEQAGDKAVGVLLTGMGRDGAAGLLKMREAGALTIGQDESTSLIYGMPKAAYELGAVAIQLPLGRIGKELVQITHKGEA